MSFNLVKIDTENYPPLDQDETEEMSSHCPVCDSWISNNLLRVEELTENPSVRRRVIYRPYDQLNKCCSIECARLLYERNTVARNF